MNLAHDNERYDAMLDIQLLAIGEALWQRRKAAGMTRAVLADITQIPIEEIERIEHGERESSFVALVRLGWWLDYYMSFAVAPYFLNKS